MDDSDKEDKILYPNEDTPEVVRPGENNDNLGDDDEFLGSDKFDDDEEDDDFGEPKEEEGL